MTDLRTQSSTVRGKIVSYLNDLIGLGADGFRVDAAKHMDKSDFASILAGLNKTTAENRAPYIAQEIFTGSTNTTLQPAAFTDNGDVLGFSYALRLKDHFTNGTVDRLSTIPSWPLDASSAKTAAMVTNHDLERDGTTLRYQDGSAYTLANYFLLAYPYGKPFLYDGFTFPTSDTGQSPPADSNGFVSDTDCSAGTWQCLTRSTGLKGMVGWHNATASVSTVSDFTATSSSVIGFHRGSLGWIGLNASGRASTATYTTGLADGTYCDVITGGAHSTGCNGTTVTVSQGRASVKIPAQGAVAVHAGALSGGGSASPSPTPTVDPTPSSTNVAVTFNAYATTTYGTNVFVVGSIPELGTWNPADALALSADNYPTWSTTVNLPARTRIEYKYLKKDPSGNLTWESTPNRSVTTGSMAVTYNNTWNVAH